MRRSDGMEDLDGAQLAILKSKLVSRNLSDFVAEEGASAAEIDKALRKITQARLDRECITVLQPSLFHCLPHLSSLYLQQNELKSLKGIEEAQELQFLTVAGNELTAIEGLKKLQKLMFLDVSGNAIEQISIEEELPKGLSFLNVSENPCCEMQDELMSNLIEYLPKLKELDGIRVAARKASFGPECKGALEYILAENETFLEDLDGTLPDDPVTNESPVGISTSKDDRDRELKELLKFHANMALPIDAVQSMLETKSKLLFTSFDEILQRSRARFLQDQQDNKEKMNAPEQTYQQGEVRVRLQDFLSASSIAKELEDLEERTILPECLYTATALTGKLASME